MQTPKFPSIRSQLPQNYNHGKPTQKSQVQLLRMADSERKINECNEDEIKAVLKYVFVLLGLNSQDIPDDVEKAVLIDFIYQSYGNKYSTTDIKNAFQMAIGGSMSVDTNLYGKRFSAAFLGRIMTEYDGHKNNLKRLSTDASKREAQLKEMADARAAESEITPQGRSDMYARALNLFTQIATTNNDIPSFYDVKGIFIALTENGWYKEFDKEKYEDEAKRLANKDTERARRVSNEFHYRDTKNWNENNMDYFFKKAVCNAYFRSVISASGSDDKA